MVVISYDYCGVTANFKIENMIKFTFYFIVMIIMTFVSCKKEGNEFLINKKTIENSYDTLWIHYRYDYCNDSINQIPDNHISSIIEFNKEIWVATPSKISVLRSGKWINYELKNPENLRDINDQLTVTHGKFSDRLISVFDNYNWNPAFSMNQRLTPFSLRSNSFSSITDVIKFDDQVFFAFFSDSVVVNKGNEFSIMTKVPKYINRFKTDSKGRLWFLGEGWYSGNGRDTLTSELIYYYKDEIKTINLPYPIKLCDVCDVEDWDGIVISSDYWHKNYRFNGNEWIDITEMFPSDRISRFVYDKKGKLWITTFGDGIAKYADKKWTIFNMYNYLKTNYISSMYFDTQNVLWIPSSSEGLLRYDGDKINLP